MKFNRGKTFSDPIYLKKPKNEYWMEGDIYTALCKCLKQIFKKNFTITAFKTKIERFMTDKEYTVCTVEDSDGDIHTFMAVVVDEMPWEVQIDTSKPETNPWVRKESTTAEPSTPSIISKTEVYTSQTIKTPTQTITVPPPAPTNAIEDFDKIKADIKQEIDIEKFKQEMEEENLLTNDDDSDKLSVKKHIKSTRKTKKA